MHALCVLLVNKILKIINTVERNTIANILAYLFTSDTDWRTTVPANGERNGTPGCLTAKTGMSTIYYDDNGNGEGGWISSVVSVIV